MNIQKLRIHWLRVLFSFALGGLVASETHAANLTISGRVTRFDGSAYPGVHVIGTLVGSTSSVLFGSLWGVGTTDVNGNYTLQTVTSFGSSTNHSYYQVRFWADGHYFSQPAQLDVTTQTSMPNINGQEIGSFPQLGSQVIWNTPGLTNWIRIGDGSYIRDVVSGASPGHSGIYYGGGKVAAGIIYNGTTDYVVPGQPSLNPPWTVSCWINRQDAAGPSAALLSDAVSAIKVEQAGTIRRVGFTRFGIGDYSFTYSLPANQWVHMVMSADTSGTKLYINGTYQGQHAVTVPLPRATIGRRDVGPSDYMKATVDELAMWNRALTAGEVGNLYSQSTFGTISGRVQAPDGRGIPGASVVLSLPAVGSVDDIPYPAIAPTATGSRTTLNYTDASGPMWPGGPTDRFGAVFKGTTSWGTVGTSYDGQQTYYLNSDDGSRLYADGQMIVNNDGNHGPLVVAGTSSLRLAPVPHNLEVRFYEGGGGGLLDAQWEGTQGTPFSRQYIQPVNVFGHFTNWTGYYYNLDRLMVVTTDVNGNYTFNNVPTRAWNIRAEYPTYGFSSAVQATPPASTISFMLVSSPPTISDIANQTINEDSSVTVNFSVFDWNTALANLQVTAQSSDPSVIAAEGLTFGGSGGTRSLTLRPRPNAIGTSTITVTVRDEAGQTAQDTFLLTVLPLNDAPVAGALTALDLSTGGARASTAVVNGLNTGNTAHTIETWLRPATVPTTRQTVLVLGPTNQLGSHFWLLAGIGGSPRLFLGTPGSQVLDVQIPINAWTHLAATWDPGTTNYTVYVNGLVARTIAITNVFNGFNLASTPFRVGEPWGPVDVSFTGRVDEVRVWNRAVSGPEIAQNYRRSLTGKEAGLMLYWRFDEASGVIAADSSYGPANGGASDGTPVGAPQFTYGPGVFADQLYRTNVVNEDTLTDLFLPGYDVEQWTNLTYTIVNLPQHGTLDRVGGQWNPFRAPLAENPIKYLPATNYNGPDFFTYRMTDPSNAVSLVATQYLVVLDANDLPLISSLSPLVIEEDNSSPLLPLTVSDAETPANLLALSAISSDRNLINPDNGGVVFSGSVSNRFVRITPQRGQIGDAQITINILDNYPGAPGLNSITFPVRVVPQPAYAVYDLGAVSSRLESYGNAINDIGWVAAHADTTSLPGPAAFLYRGFETEELSLALGTSGAATTRALAINNSGLMAGLSQAAGAGPRAARWDPATLAMTALSTTVSGTATTNSEGRAINSDGAVAGMAWLNGQPVAALWTPANTASSLGFLPGGNRSEAFALNDLGLAAGYSTKTGGAEQACVFSNNTVISVQTLANDAQSRALAINGLGHVAGFSASSPGGLPRAFLRNNLGVRNLGLITNALSMVARSLNDFGQVVGTATLGNTETRPFFYSADKLYDLNDLLPEDSGWTLNDARAINQNGWIAGYGRNSSGQLRAYLAVPAWVIGRQIARPEGTVPRPPQIELLGDRGLNNEQNSFAWSQPDQKQYAIRPVKARIKWFTSFQDVTQVGTNFIANTNRIVVVGASIWPRVPTRYVATTPVEVEPQGVSFDYRFQNIEYAAGSAATVEPNTKIFQSSSPGYTVLRYTALGDDGVADPLVDPPAFDVVRTHFWSNAPVFAEQSWFVADTITYSNHFDYLGKNGYVFFEKAFYDGTGTERAYDRVSRRGAIIPVNAPTLTSANPTNQMVVVWYQTNQLGVAWGSRALRYNLQWPDGISNKIIIASMKGSGPLPDNLFPNRRVYNQPDPTLPGFNPNEEHALIAPGETGEALYALRSDINAPVGGQFRYSAPYALLKHRDSVTGDWKMRAYKVIPEEAPYFFQYPGEAGKEIQPPVPLSVLPLCGNSYEVSGPYWEDHQGKIYARAAGENGGTADVVVRWFYPLQPGFWYDVDGDGSNDAPISTCVPWLDRLPGGSVGTPVNVTYNIRWPDRDNYLLIGQTLLKSAEDPYGGNLPEIKNQAKAEIIFDSLNPNDTNRLANLARLYDPLTPRIIKTGVVIPDTTARVNIAGKEYFRDLPWPLKIRLSYDPVNKWLAFAGYLDETFDVGQPLLLPNILSSNEVSRIKALAPASTSWASLIDQLYALCRNPNGVDLDLDGQADNALRVGLTTETNAGIAVVVPEKFGSQPKALTSALGGVAAAQPLPGSALRFDGADDSVTTASSVDFANQSFTIEFWAKRDSTPGTNYIFSQSGAGDPNQRLLIGFRSDGAFTFRFGGNSLDVAGDPGDFNWHHWACVFNVVTSGRAIYRDGVRITEDEAPSSYFGSGPLVFGSGNAANYFRGDVDEIRVWTTARSGFDIQRERTKRLKGVEPDLFVYYRLDENSGATATDASGHNLDGQLQGPTWVASTAPCGIPPRYVTLAFNSDPALPGLPVSLAIIRVDDGPFVGDLKVLPADNVFDQRLSFRHSSEFGGNPDAVQFEWYYKFDTANFDPTALPQVDPANPDNVTPNGWIQYTGYQPPSGMGVNDVTLGEGGESGLLIMSDTWWICRYRGYNINLQNNVWSGWVGDPASLPGQPRAKLAEGWIKRVIRGLNPFDQRVADFHQNAVATYVSMIEQAGDRYKGDIAFNPSADAINSVGLIEAYETVLRRGRGLSIEGVPSVNFDPANNALLLVSGKLADFYMLLGNEAYGDAQDPTIGFGSSSTEYGSLSSSIFAFQNQLDSLLEEELNLLRGRDDSQSGVGAPPYNRLIWNFTLGEGEIAYKQVYNIKDVIGAQDTAGRPIPDGFIDERDARRMYPQGHGDAWGHYLMAIKKYYALMRHPNFTWVPRTENVSVGGAAVQVDFQDERKFARAAAAKAKTGKETVNLTYRLNYTEDPNGQWQGYKDTKTDRAWGVDEWARRAGMGAYFDWLAANTVLPAEDTDPNHTGIEKVDRRTVGELAEIPAYLNEIQAQLDMADAGLNPLGLVKGATIFDIDPTFNAVGSTAQIGRQAVQGLGHFEQIKERAVKTLNNSARVWDEANRASQQLREQQDDLASFQRDYRNQEFDYRNRLIEIYGYPYASDIGPGKTYPNGYNGPDLYRYMYVNVTEITGENSPPSSTFTAFFTAPSAGAFLSTNDFFLGFTDPSSLDPSTNGILPVSFHLSAGSYGFAATSAMGQRRAQGEIQFALSEMVQANAQLKIAAQNYDGLIQDIKAAIDLLAEHYNVSSNNLQILETQQGDIVGRNVGIGIFKAAELAARQVVESVTRVGDVAADALPKVVGLANDVLSAGRVAIKATALGVVTGFAIAGDVAELSQVALELSKEEIALQTEIDLLTEDQRFEVLQRVKELESLIRNEAAARLELYNQEEVVRQAAQHYLTVLSQGQRVLEELVNFRRDSSAEISERRYQDMTFRVFRNDAIQKYRAQYDLAARYTYLAATVYDYETSFLGPDPRAGRRFLNDIIKQRALGQITDGNPIVGAPGLADSIARLEASFEVIRGQFGINNPQLESGHFSLRNELYRMHDTDPDNQDASDADWRAELRRHYVSDLWSVPEFRRYCRPFAPESAGPQPGLVIPFSTTVTFGLNYFGWPLAGGDSAFDPTFYSTKINALGIQFDGYSTTALSVTPRVYLIPVGMDVLRSPTGDTLATREYRIFDQALPIPFPIGNSDLGNAGWIPINDTLSGAYGQVRRFSSMRAFPTEAFADLGDAEMAANTRLVGRSVWNTQWLLVIPGGTLLFDPNRGIDGFIDSVTDIRLLMMTYSYAGN